MPEKGKGKANRGWANLKPAKPGEVRNPTGKNQWDYRREFERNISALMQEHGAEIAARLVTAAKGRNDRLLIALLDRVFPRVERHEVEGDLGLRADAGTLAALEDRLARLAGTRAPKRDPGDADGSGSEGAE